MNIKNDNSIPTCPICGFQDVFRERRRGIPEKIISWFGYYPYFCKTPYCQKRFFSYRKGTLFKAKFTSKQTSQREKKILNLYKGEEASEFPTRVREPLKARRKIKASRNLNKYQRFLLDNRLPIKKITLLICWIFLVGTITKFINFMDVSKIFDPDSVKTLFQQLPLKTANNFIDYQNDYNGLKIKYPSNWKKVDIENPVTGEVVMFIAPQQQEGNKFQEKLIIKVEYLLSKTDLNQYTISSIKEINQFFPDAKIIDSTSIRIANHLAHQIVYIGKDEEDRFLKNMEVWIIKGKKVYGITYTSALESYTNSFEDAQKTINSLEFF